MKVTVENLGPISSASIDLNDLNIFVGPNNSGKSLLATTLYIACQNPLFYSTGLLVKHLSDWVQVTPPDDLRELDEFIQRRSFEEISTPYLSLPIGVRNSFEQIVSTFLKQCGQLISTELAKVHGDDLSRLRHPGIADHNDRMRVRLTYRDPGWSLEISSDSASPAAVVVDPPEPADLWARIIADPRLVNESHSLARILEFKERRATHWPGFSIAIFVLLVLNNSFREAIPNVYYLPAARSGLMHAHRALAASMIQQAARFGQGENRSPMMAGVVADFLTELVQLDADRASRRNTPSVGVAEALERDILHGVVALDANPLGYSEFFYDDGNGRYPLIRTSSMVSELAPVVLYLRYLLNEGDLLILEEPEAHLHPANQVAFARNIVRLVNGGNPALLTTHSEFFLEQLNNSIVAHTLGDQARPSGYDEQATIAPDKVSAYLFEPSPEGTRVRKLDVTPTEGIEPVGFEKVEEALYSDSVTLTEEINRAGE